MGKKLELSGQKFGRLLVVSFAGLNKNNLSLWNCICDCGEKCVILGSLLKKGNTKSCGCYRRELTINKNKNLTAHTIVDEVIVASAKRVFINYNDGNITFNDFYFISQENCFWCGNYLSNHFNKFAHKKHKVSDFSKIYGNFYYNGLDRVNNKFGHNLDNVVPCCRTCNSFKGNMSIYEFFNIIKCLNEEPKLLTYDKIENKYNSLEKIKNIYNLKNNYNILYLSEKIRHIKDKAKTRDINMRLTDLQIAQLIISPCVYSGMVVSPRNRNLNGIDRLDSNLGYTIDNCVSSSWICNRGKNDLSLKDFIFWIKQVKKYQSENDLLANLLKRGVKIPDR